MSFVFNCVALCVFVLQGINTKYNNKLRGVLIGVCTASSVSHPPKAHCCIWSRKSCLCRRYKISVFTAPQIWISQLHNSNRNRTFGAQNADCNHSLEVFRRRRNPLAGRSAVLLVRKKILIFQFPRASHRRRR